MHYHALSRYPESDVVLVNQAGQEKVIVVKPNHSATWRHNLWLLAALAVPSLGAGIAFALLGAWPILPLAGLELTALAGALYWVNWKLEYRHVIRLTDQLITIDKAISCQNAAGALLETSRPCGWYLRLIIGRVQNCRCTTVSPKPGSVSFLTARKHCNY